MDALNTEDNSIKTEIVSLITKYLEEEGFHSAAMVLRDEASERQNIRVKKQTQFKKLRSCIMDGLWDEVVPICKQLFNQDSRFLYAVHRQQYLEQLERREIQQGFTFLTKRIKPFESIIPKDEMKDLCYVLTCHNVQDATSFKNWLGKAHRNQLVEQLETMLELESQNKEVMKPVPPNRLQTLLKQSIAYQIEKCGENMETQPKVTTILDDFEGLGLPNKTYKVIEGFEGNGHNGNVKCLDFVGTDGNMLITGSSDATVKLWSIDSGDLVRTCEGHVARVWDVCSARSGKHFVSASADATMKVWETSSGNCITTIQGHKNDVYSVTINPGDTHVLSGGYDQTIRLFDLQAGKLVNSFQGHENSVSRAIFNDYGNLIVSGGKDCAVKVWDISSGLCIKTLAGEFAQITSVDLNRNSQTLLIGTKSNTNVLVDLRMGLVIRRFRGHQNSSRHFIRSNFGPIRGVVTSGSEDGKLYMWDTTSGEIVKTLHGHDDVVYQGIWHPQRRLLASCSDDRTVRLWNYEHVADVSN
eukprot:m.187094 g.187094  ORF g.187094 m.187094 type:complete len:527 (+) comp15600_c0_seq3:55-1635(+)